jgi:hypothetical protein
MLKILSPLEMLQRVDVTVKTTSTVFASGTTGSWVQLVTNGGNTECQLPTTAGKPAWTVWTEGNRTVDTSSLPGALGQLTPAWAGAVGFTPDAVRSGKVTTLVGKWRGLTDQVAQDGSTYAVGDLLKVATTAPYIGKLTKITTCAFSGVNADTMLNYPVAIIRGGVFSSYVYLGQTYTGVYEIENLV